MRISDHGAPAQPERSEQGKARRYLFHGQSVVAPALAGGLHLVATPIGNLRDITLRALEVLAAADLIACEDTRVTRKLIDHYGITTPLTPYHDHNAEAARPKLLARLAAGGAVALVSDAGTPLISDPGFKLGRAARAAGYPVTTLPGAYAHTPAPRGEIVIVVAPPPAVATDAAELDALLREALARLSVKEAVGEVAAVTGEPRREVYQRALALAKDREADGDDGTGR